MKIRHNILNRLVVFAALAQTAVLNQTVVANIDASTMAQTAHWVGTWGCGIQLIEPRNLPPPPGLSSNTLRMIVHSSIGGKQIRVHFSNLFGTKDVEMKSVHLALNPSVMTSSAIETEHWYNIEDIDVMADDSWGMVVTFGDSITDGRGSTIGGNNRWPDIFHTNSPTAHVGAVNTGIGGNAIFGGLGPAAVKRFDRDVLGKNGVRWAIIFESVNDIGGVRGPRAAALATNLIAAFQQFAAKAHVKHIRIYGATVTPFGGNGYYSVEHEAIRQEVNAWIRTNSVFDGLIDFDAAVRDPADETKFKSEYHPGLNANDWLHLNPDGYRAMAEAVDLNLFLTK